MTKKGFSLVELVIALGIVIIMTGAAALYLGDIYFKSQVAKSLGDMETIANALLLHDTENGADRYESNLPGSISTTGIYKDKDELSNLLGNYLAVLPNDPWGNTYRVNSYAGYIRTYASDYKINGTSKYEKDISAYYLPEDLLVAKLRVEDNNLSLDVDTNDSLVVYFTKSVRCNVQDANTADANSAAISKRTTAGGGVTAADATYGWFEAQDFVGLVPGGTITTLNDGGAATSAEDRYLRPSDSPFTDSEFSRRLVVPALDGSNGEFGVGWKIGADAWISTTNDNDGVAGTREFGYCIWESTQGYLNYKTTGEKAKIYLKDQDYNVSKRTILFKTIID